MATTEQPIVDRILSGTAVAAIAGDKVSPELRREGDPLPAITYEVQDEDTSNGTLNAKADLVRLSMLVHCWHDSYDGARELAKAVRARLDGGPFTGVDWCTATPVATETQAPDDGTGDGARNSSLLVVAWIRE